MSKDFKIKVQEIYSNNLMSNMITNTVVRYMNSKENLEYLKDMAVKAATGDSYETFDRYTEYYESYVKEEYKPASRRLDDLQDDLQINITDIKQTGKIITYKVKNRKQKLNYEK